MQIARFPSLRRIATFGVLSLLAFEAAGGLALQAAPDQAKQLDEDIAFAQDLARWRYFDLAVEWLAGIEGRSDLGPAHKNLVVLQKANIAKLASEHALTREARAKFYDDAIAHYQTAIAAMPEAMSLDKAVAIVDGLATVLKDKGEYYAEELAGLRASGAPDDQLAAARAAAEAGFKEAVKTLNETYGELDARSQDEDLPEEDKQRLRELALFSQFRKGQAYFSWADLYEPQDFNREDYLTKCIESLIDFIWEAGDESAFFTAYAYYYQGMAEFQLGRIPAGEAAARDEKAIASLSFIYSGEVIDPAVVATIEDEADREVVISLLERAYHGAAQVYRSAADRYEADAALSETEDLTRFADGYMVSKNAGDKPWMATPPVYKPALIQALRSAAIAAVDELEQRLAAVQLPLGPFGERARLEKARTLATMGSGAQALEIVKAVAESNTGNVVGLEAQGLLAELLGQVESGEQPPGVLRLAAEGFLAEGRLLDAIETLHKMIAACKTPEEKKEHLTYGWSTIGQSYSDLGRNLEAALAFEQGIAAARENGADEETTGDLASRAYGAWNRRFVETKHDFDRGQRDRVRDLVIQLGASADLQYFVAKEAFSNAFAAKEPETRKKLFETSIAEFDKVPAESIYHERALVYKARCQAEAGKPDEAIATFDALFARANDPKHRVGLERKKQQQRDIALAEGAFYKAGVQKDTNKFADVLKTLEGYETAYPNQAAFYPNVEYYRLLAHVGLGDLAAAADTLGRMETQYKDDRSVTYAYNAIAGGHFAAYQALPDKTTEPARAHLRSAADYLAEYNKRTGYGSFTNLQNVGDWYKELGDWKQAEDMYRRLQQDFGANPAHQKALQRDIKQDLAEVLSAQENFVEAEPLWSEVYAAKGNDRDVVRSYARCLGGFLKEEQTAPGAYTYKEITGVGKYTEAMELWAKLKKGIEDAGDENSDDWWDTNLSYLYCLHLESAKNPQLKESGLRLVKNWRSLKKSVLADPKNAKWNRILERLDRALQSGR